MKPFPRILALFLSLTIVLPNPAFALRIQAGLENSSEPQLAGALTAGVEEKPNVNGIAAGALAQHLKQVKLSLPKSVDSPMAAERQQMAAAITQERNQGVFSSPDDFVLRMTGKVQGVKKAVWEALSQRLVYGGKTEQQQPNRRRLLKLGAAGLALTVLLGWAAVKVYQWATATAGRAIWVFNYHTGRQDYESVVQSLARLEGERDVVLVLEQAPIPLSMLEELEGAVARRIQSPESLNDPAIRRDLQQIFEHLTGTPERIVARLRANPALLRDREMRQTLGVSIPLYEYLVRHPEVTVVSERPPFESFLEMLRADLELRRAANALFRDNNRTVYFQVMARAYRSMQRMALRRDQDFVIQLRELFQASPRAKAVIHRGVAHFRALEMAGDMGNPAIQIESNQLDLTRMPLLERTLQPHQDALLRNEDSSIPEQAQSSILRYYPWLALLAVFSEEENLSGEAAAAEVDRLILPLTNEETENLLGALRTHHGLLVQAARGDFAGWLEWTARYTVGWLNSRGKLDERARNRLPADHRGLTEERVQQLLRGRAGLALPADRLAAGAEEYLSGWRGTILTLILGVSLGLSIAGAAQVPQMDKKKDFSAQLTAAELEQALKAITSVVKEFKDGKISRPEALQQIVLRGYRDSVAFTLYSKSKKWEKILDSGGWRVDPIEKKSVPELSGDLDRLLDRISQAYKEIGPPSDDDRKADPQLQWTWELWGRHIPSLRDLQAKAEKPGVDSEKILAEWTQILSGMQDSHRKAGSPKYDEMIKAPFGFIRAAPPHGFTYSSDLSNQIMFRLNVDLYRTILLDAAAQKELDGLRDRVKAGKASFGEISSRLRVLQARVDRFSGVWFGLKAQQGLGKDSEYETLLRTEFNGPLQEAYKAGRGLMESDNKLEKQFLLQVREALADVLFDPRTPRVSGKAVRTVSGKERPVSNALLADEVFRRHYIPLLKDMKRAAQDKQPNAAAYIRHHLLEVHTQFPFLLRFMDEHNLVLEESTIQEVNGLLIEVGKLRRELPNKKAGVEEDSLNGILPQVAVATASAAGAEEGLIREFGNTGLRFHVLGAGTIWLGRPWPPENTAYAYPDQQEISNYLDEIFDRLGNSEGRVMVDTAASYGFTEKQIGEYFGAHPDRFQKVFIAAKWGERQEHDGSKGIWEQWKFSPDYSLDNLRKSVVESLKHLGKIDLLYIHMVGGATTDVLWDRAVIGEMVRMRKDHVGGIRYIGVSISDPKVLEEAVRNNLLAIFDVIQIPGSVFLNRADLVQALRKDGKAIVLNSVIRKGDRSVSEKEAYFRLLNDPNVSMILTGSRNHYRDNIGYVEEWARRPAAGAEEKTVGHLSIPPNKPGFINAATWNVGEAALKERRLRGQAYDGYIPLGKDTHFFNHAPSPSGSFSFSLAHLLLKAGAPEMTMNQGPDGTVSLRFNRDGLLYSRQESSSRGKLLDLKEHGLILRPKENSGTEVEFKVSGEAAPQRFSVPQDVANVQIGKDPVYAADEIGDNFFIQLKNVPKEISRLHLTLTVSKGFWDVIDQSANGTFVRAIDAQRFKEKVVFPQDVATWKIPAGLKEVPLPAEGLRIRDWKGLKVFNLIVANDLWLLSAAPDGKSIWVVSDPESNTNQPGKELKSGFTMALGDNPDPAHYPPPALLYSWPAGDKSLSAFIVSTHLELRLDPVEGLIIRDRLPLFGESAGQVTLSVKQIQQHQEDSRMGSAAGAEDQLPKFKDTLRKHPEFGRLMGRWRDGQLRRLISAGKSLDAKVVTTILRGTPFRSGQPEHLASFIKETLGMDQTVVDPAMERFVEEVTTRGRLFEAAYERRGAQWTSNKILSRWYIKKAAGIDIPERLADLTEAEADLLRTQVHMNLADENTLRAILRTRAGEPPSQKTAIVLGIGRGHDIPLLELALVYQEVVIVDLDRSGLRDVVEQLRNRLTELELPPEKVLEITGRVSPKVADLSGIADRVARFSSGLKKDKRFSRDQAVQQALEFFRKEARHSVWPIPKELQGRYDLVISSLVASQIDDELMRYVAKTIAERDGTPDAMNILRLLGEFSQGAEGFLVTNAAHHADLLSRLVKPGGVAYFSTDLTSMSGRGHDGSLLFHLDSFLRRAGQQGLRNVRLGEWLWQGRAMVQAYQLNPASERVPPPAAGAEEDARIRHVQIFLNRYKAEAKQIREMSWERRFFNRLFLSGAAYNQQAAELRTRISERIPGLEDDVEKALTDRDYAGAIRAIEQVLERIRTLVDSELHPEGLAEEKLRVRKEVEHLAENLNHALGFLPGSSQYKQYQIEMVLTQLNVYEERTYRVASGVSLPDVGPIRAILSAEDPNLKEADRLISEARGQLKKIENASVTPEDLQTLDRTLEYAHALLAVQVEEDKGLSADEPGQTEEPVNAFLGRGLTLKEVLNQLSNFKPDLVEIGQEMAPGQDPIFVGDILMPDKRGQWGEKDATHFLNKLKRMIPQGSQGQQPSLDLVIRRQFRNQYGTPLYGLNPPYQIALVGLFLPGSGRPAAGAEEKAKTMEVLAKELWTSGGFGFINWKDPAGGYPPADPAFVAQFAGQVLKRGLIPKLGIPEGDAVSLEALRIFRKEHPTATIGVAIEQPSQVADVIDAAQNRNLIISAPGGLIRKVFQEIRKAELGLDRVLVIAKIKDLSEVWPVHGAAGAQYGLEVEPAIGPTVEIQTTRILLDYVLTNDYLSLVIGVGSAGGINNAEDAESLLSRGYVGFSVGPATLDAKLQWFTAAQEALRRWKAQTAIQRGQGNLGYAIAFLERAMGRGQVDTVILQGANGETPLKVNDLLLKFSSLGDVAIEIGKQLQQMSAGETQEFLVELYGDKRLRIALLPLNPPLAVVTPGAGEVLAEAGRAINRIKLEASRPVGQAHILYNDASLAALFFLHLPPPSGLSDLSPNIAVVDPARLAALTAIAESAGFPRGDVGLWVLRYVVLYDPQVKGDIRRATRVAEERIAQRLPGATPVHISRLPDALDQFGPRLREILESFGLTFQAGTLDGGVISALYQVAQA